MIFITLAMKADRAFSNVSGYDSFTIDEGRSDAEFVCGTVSGTTVFSAHGLRKAGATIAANNGATSRQLMAIFGRDTLKAAERYTRGADQTRLAASVMHLLASREPPN